MSFVSIQSLGSEDKVLLVIISIDNFRRLQCLKQVPDVKICPKFGGSIFFFRGLGGPD
jgi:hypothetical protein